MPAGTLIYVGAEAQLYHAGDRIIKVRTPKSYRHPAIDERLRSTRTKREAAILKTLTTINFPAPALIATNNYDEITMGYLPGEKVADIFESADVERVAYKIGSNVARLHAQNIIHADLTTSNMILLNEQVFFIDFGLSYHSSKQEDKAVDLHLLQQSIRAKHPTIAEAALRFIMEGYRTLPEAMEILERLKLVERRGRNKHK